MPGFGTLVAVVRGRIRSDVPRCRPTQIVTCTLDEFPHFQEGTSRMLDTQSVDFVLRLPADLAESAEEVASRDPDYLHRVVRYGLVRRAIYEELEHETDGSTESETFLPPPC